MRHDTAMKNLCVRCSMTTDIIINGELASERSLRDIKMIESRVLETSRNNTGSVEDGNEIAQEDEKECGQ